MPVTARFARVEAGFLADGFSIVLHTSSPKGDAFGVRAERPAAGGAARDAGAAGAVAAPGRRKTAFYLEGDNYQMGWLLGSMAEPEVSRMATEFVENVAFAFFDESATEGGLLSPLKDLIVHLIVEAAERMLPDIPSEYLEEIDGIVDGCTAANPGTPVRRDRLLALNLGIDCVLAHIYTGTLFAEKGYHPRQLRTAIGCNAFSISGAAAAGRHFFGRDFMFPTANVFQDTACLVVCVPAARGGARRQPFISQTAPGIVGCMTGMNAAGVAMGVDMLPSRLCDPQRPGLNSLLLVRDCIQHCVSAHEVADRVAEAPRGVSWLYPVADRHGGAFMIEAGRRLGRREAFPYFSFVPRSYRRLLPGRRFIERMRRAYGTPAPRAGMVARGTGYRYPKEYIEAWNPGLWRAYDRNWLVRLLEVLGDLAGLVGDLLRGRVHGLRARLREEMRKIVAEAVLSPDAFTERGAINRSWTDTNCPGPFYFAPQRESRPDVVLATNAPITTEMRLTCMTEWIALLAGRNLNDIQWRYDELCREILEALDAEPGGIGEKAAWDIIDFLRPDGRFPAYYNNGPADEWEKVQVHGSVSLCELTGLSFTTRFGCYGDPPITLHLGPFLSMTESPPRT